MEKRETGAASMLIELSDGRITVTHATDDVQLCAWDAIEGHWDRLWDTIRILQKEGERMSK